MEIEVFPTTQALTVTDGPGWVSLTQFDDSVGRDAQIFIPADRVEDAIRALRAAAAEAKKAAEDLED